MKTELREIARALEMRAMGQGERWPTDEEGLGVLDMRLPTDPWGNEYQYEATARTMMEGYPEVFSKGPDGVAGTDDDIHHEWSGR